MEIAYILLLLAGLIALRQWPLATVIATVGFVGSIGVGLLGAYFLNELGYLAAG